MASLCLGGALDAATTPSAARPWKLIGGTTPSGTETNGGNVSENIILAAVVFQSRKFFHKGMSEKCFHVVAGRNRTKTDFSAGVNLVKVSRGS